MSYLNQVDVILLAAGKGVRLGNLTNDAPKCLLPIFGNKTILDIYLEFFLPDQFVRSVCVIGGYEINTLSDHLLTQWSSEIENGRIILLDNPIYESTNNIVTFIQTASFFRSGGILIEADLVCSPNLYQKVLDEARENPDHSFLVIDESSKDRPDAMRISKHPNGMISEIGKNVDLAISEGEFLGISYLSPQDAANAIEVCGQLIRQGKNQLFYEEGFATATTRGNLPLDSLPTAGFKWSEVDDIEDYQRAKALLETFDIS